GTVLNLAGLGVLHGASDVRGNGANFRVRHQATWAQDLTQGTNDTHGVRGSDHDVERHVAGFDALSQVFHTNHVGAGCFSSFSLVAGSEHSNANGLAGASWQHDGTTHHLVGFLRVHAQLDGHVDRLVELGGRQFFNQGHCVVEGVHFGTVYFSLD